MTTQKDAATEIEYHDRSFRELFQRNRDQWMREAEYTVSVYKTPLCYLELQEPDMKDEIELALSDIAGKRVLVIGAGLDCAAIWFARRGCVTDVVDISKESVSAQQEMAEHVGVDIHAVVADATETPFEDGSYDLVYGNGVLHHLDTREAAAEIRRLLKPGGKGLFRDVLAGSLFIRLFRVMTPFWRTPTEHPLKESDFRTYAESFSKLTVTPYAYSSLLYKALLRAWNAICNGLLSGKGQIGPIASVLRGFGRLDARLFRAFPFLKRGAWLCVVQMERS